MLENIDLEVPGCKDMKRISKRFIKVEGGSGSRKGSA